MYIWYTCRDVGVVVVVATVALRAIASVIEAGAAAAGPRAVSAVVVVAEPWTMTRTSNGKHDVSDNNVPTTVSCPERRLS